MGALGRVEEICIVEDEIERRPGTKQALHYRLIDYGGDSGGAVALAFVERNGEWALCIEKIQVGGVLNWSHDGHGHFSDARSEHMNSTV